MTQKDINIQDLRTHLPLAQELADIFEVPFDAYRELFDFHTTDEDRAKALFSICFGHYTKHLHTNREEAEFVKNLEAHYKGASEIVMTDEQAVTIKHVMDGMLATAFILSVLNRVS